MSEDLTLTLLVVVLTALLALVGYIGRALILELQKHRFAFVRFQTATELRLHWLEDHSRTPNSINPERRPTV